MNRLRDFNSPDSARETNSQPPPQVYIKKKRKNHFEYDDKITILNEQRPTFESNPFFFFFSKKTIRRIEDYEEGVSDSRGRGLISDI